MRPDALQVHLLEAGHHARLPSSASCRKSQHLLILSSRPSETHGDLNERDRLSLWESLEFADLPADSLQPAQKENIPCWIMFQWA
jgi:hypothetical protein